MGCRLLDRRPTDTRRLKRPKDPQAARIPPDFSSLQATVMVFSRPMSLRCWAGSSRGSLAIWTFMLLIGSLAVPAHGQLFVDPVHDGMFGRSPLDTPAGFGLNRGIGVDSSSGDVYVTDDKLRRFDGNGNLITSWDCGGCYGVDVNLVNHDVYVAQRGGRTIAQYDSSGNFIRDWGGEGIGDGQFLNPVDLVVDSTNGEIYVLDGFSVQVFDLTGTFLRRFGSVGSAPAQFSGTMSIYQIAFDPATETVWTADAPGDRLAAFDRFGNFIRGWSGNNNGTAFGDFRWARGLDVDSNGDVYIADADNERVTGYSALGVPIVEYQGPHDLANGPFHPRSIAINRTTGERYVAAGYAFRVDKFDSSNNFLFSWGDRETDGVALNEPRGIAVSQATGDVFVLDTGHFLMKRFSSAGVFLNQWGGSIRIDGLADGLFGFTDVPVATDSAGNPWAATENIHYVGDPFSHHLQKFAPDGTFLLGVQPQANPAFGYSEFKFGMAIDPSTDYVYISDAHPARNHIRIHDSAGLVIGSIGNIPGPAGVAIHGDHLYVASSTEHTVRKFEFSGTSATLVRTIGGIGEFSLLKESGLATDSGGSLYVADSGNHRVQIYAPNGHLLTGFGSSGSGPGQFRIPRGVAVNRAGGELFVLDTGRDRVQKYLLSLDNDADTVPDASDNCVYEPNAGQEDGGGIGAGSASDGIGDACQCGDLNQDAVVDGADVTRYRQALAGLGGPLAGVELERCSVIGERRDCGLVDIIVMIRALAAQEPPIRNVCAP